MLLITLLLALAAITEPAFRQGSAESFRERPPTVATLPALLARTHLELFGAPPTRARLAMAGAQLRLEGLSLCGRNLGALGAGGAEPSCRVGPARLRAWPSYDDAARGYWRLLRARCAGALVAFDSGDPEASAAALRRCGYFRAPVERYARGLRSLLSF